MQTNSGSALKRKRWNTSIAEYLPSILEALGENPRRKGLLRTPERYESAMEYLTGGYAIDASQIVNSALFDSDSDGMVIIKNIEFFSLCEHHLLPFFGRIHIGYLPNGKVVGLSKIPRIVDMFARRLQTQEAFTRQVGEAIFKLVKPRGVAVLSEARHFCMMMRGVQKQHAKTVTNAMFGIFPDDSCARDEFRSGIADTHRGAGRR